MTYRDQLIASASTNRGLFQRLDAMKAAADNGMTLTEADFYYCRKCCTDKVIASYDYSEGFAGGGIDFYTLSCGHTECDDSSDVAAAR